MRDAEKAEEMTESLRQMEEVSGVRLKLVCLKIIYVLRKYNVQCMQTKLF